MSTDRIEKKILLRATRQRVWRAISDSTEFGTWFGVKFEGPFAPGASMRGVLAPPLNVELAAATRRNTMACHSISLSSKWNRSGCSTGAFTLQPPVRRRCAGHDP